MKYDDLITLGIAFGLGLLVGLQREKNKPQMAGVRTFTLVALLGTVIGILSRDYGNPFLIPAFAIAITAIMVISNYLKSRQDGETRFGITTEMSMLLMFALGSYLVEGNKIIGVIVGGTIVILLYVKDILHSFIHNLEDKDLSAIMTFTAISLIILPILPNQDFGPYETLNPREIWLMVTLIVGISVLGYFLYKWVGKKAGMVSNGILGGLISSTATAVSYARSSASNKDFSRVSAFVICAATTISVIRAIVEIVIIVPRDLPQLIAPFLVLLGFMVIVSIVVFYSVSNRSEKDSIPEPDNPAQFKSALIFGVMYAIIILTVAFAEDKFGDRGLYLVSIIGGLAKTDAVTLSLAQSIKGGMDTSLGWRLIMTGLVSSMVFKTVLSFILGSRILAKWLSISVVLSAVFGTLLILFWPK